MAQSKRWSWNDADTKAALNQALVFLTPTLLVLIPSIIGIIPTEWKYGAVIVYLLNRVVDVLRRWYAGK
ncbi:MAG: hypothetical protein NUV86_12660 [Candidatus Scalindua sp.]|nr:hypothetical protein [Candidatus Scalindua sp.]